MEHVSNVFDDPSPTVHSDAVSISPILSLARFAIDYGMLQEKVEGLIGTSLDGALTQEKIPYIAGPILFNQILIDGITDAPAIELAQSAPLSFLGGLEKLVLLAPTGREALRALAANFPAFHDALSAKLDETQSYLRFSFKYDGAEHDNGCCNEVIVSFIVRLMRSVFGAHGQPHEVQMRYGRNGTTSAYQAFIASPVKFWMEDEGFSIIYKKTDMEWAQPGYDPELYELALQRLSSATALRQQGTPATDYFRLIRASNLCTQAGLFSVSAVAAKAGLGERTAQRVAHRHGSSVGKLIDQARLRMLRQQLARFPETDAEDLSVLIGFSESRALRRAVKAWTGKSLASFRADHEGYN